MSLCASTLMSDSLSVPLAIRQYTATPGTFVSSDTMADYKRVGFKTFDGVTLRGNFFQARGDKVPAVIMAHEVRISPSKHCCQPAKHQQSTVNSSPLRKKITLMILLPVSKLLNFPFSSTTTEPGVPVRVFHAPRPILSNKPKISTTPSQPSNIYQALTHLAFASGASPTRPDPL